MDEEPDIKLRNEKMKRMLEKLARVLNPEKIDRYIETQLAGRDRMSASELPLSDAEDFVKIIYTRLYGQRKNMNYQIRLKEEVDRSGYRFQDFEIARK